MRETVRLRMNVKNERIFMIESITPILYFLFHNGEPLGWKTFDFSIESFDHGAQTSTIQKVQIALVISWYIQYKPYNKL